MVSGGTSQNSPLSTWRHRGIPIWFFDFDLIWSQFLESIPSFLPPLFLFSSSFLSVLLSHPFFPFLFCSIFYISPNSWNVWWKMGNCGSRTNEDSQNDTIDRQIKTDRVKLNNEVKLLLLGKRQSSPSHSPFTSFGSFWGFFLWLFGVFLLLRFVVRSDGFQIGVSDVGWDEGWDEIWDGIFHFFPFFIYLFSIDVLTM